MNKRTLTLLILTYVLPLCSAAQVWPLAKAKNWYAQQGWLVGANYTPAYAVNQLEFWQKATFDIIAIDRELALASNIGMNVMRVYLHHVAWQQDKQGFKQRMRSFLAVAAKHQIKVLFVLFDDCWNPTYAAGQQPSPKTGVHNSGWVKDPGKRWYDGEPGLEATLKSYAVDILGSFKNDKRILMWDLYNEPGWSGQFDKAYELAQKVFSWARTVKLSQPVSICIWNDEPKFEKLNALALSQSDVVTYHNYQNLEKHKAQVEQLKKTGRPLICTEYMARKHGSTFATILPMLKQENVGAINWGLVAGKTNTIYAWDEPMPDGGEPKLWFHDIFRADGKPYDPKETELIKALTKIIPLYPEGKIPFAKAGTEVPKLTVFKPVKDLAKGTAVIVCSGGAYGGRANSVEGGPACKKLQEAGITAFLLDYRVPRTIGMERKEIVPLTDAQRAIQYLREHAKTYNINPDKLGIMGFSAGGHLVSTVGTHFNKTELSNPKNSSLRPDFMVLVYPVISFADSLTHLDSRMNLIGPDITAEKIKGYSNELQVTEQTPPTYLTSGMDDKIVDVKNSLYFAAALKQHHVPVELFLYEQGYHGYGVNNRQSKVQWIDDCIDWIKKERYKQIK